MDSIVSIREMQITNKRLVFADKNKYEQYVSKRNEGLSSVSSEIQNIMDKHFNNIVID